MTARFTVAVAVQFEDPADAEIAEGIALAQIPAEVDLGDVSRMTHEEGERRFVGYKWDRQA